MDTLIKTKEAFIGTTPQNPIRTTVPIVGVDSAQFQMLVKQSGNIPTLIVFVEYALNNSKVRDIDKGQWFINISTLVEHLNNHLQLSPLDVDLGYDMDLAQFITDIHWTLAHYQDCILNLKIKTEIAIKQLFFDRQTETLHVLLDFVIL